MCAGGGGRQVAWGVVCNTLLRDKFSVLWPFHKHSLRPGEIEPAPRRELRLKQFDANRVGIGIRPARLDQDDPGRLQMAPFEPLDDEPSRSRGADRYSGTISMPSRMI